MAHVNGQKRGFAEAMRKAQAQRIVAAYFQIRACGAEPSVAYSPVSEFAGMQTRLVYNIGRLYTDDFDWREAHRVARAIGIGHAGPAGSSCRRGASAPDARWEPGPDVVLDGIEVFGQMAIEYLDEVYG